MYVSNNEEHTILFWAENIARNKFNTGRTQEAYLSYYTEYTLQLTVRE